MLGCLKMIDNGCGQVKPWNGNGTGDGRVRGSDLDHLLRERPEGEGRPEELPAAWDEE